MSEPGPRLLGIDPGTRLTGFACTEGRAHPPRLVEAGVFRLGKTPGVRELAPIADRLVELEQDLVDLIARTKPDALAVEAVFAHPRHPATAITMGHARGVILLAARRAGLTLVELKPAEIKKALTGHGNASKAQMQRSVQDLFRLPEPPSPPDVADAIAIATACAQRLAIADARGCTPTLRA